MLYTFYLCDLLDVQLYFSTRGLTSSLVLNLDNFMYSSLRLFLVDNFIYFNINQHEQFDRLKMKKYFL